MTTRISKENEGYFLISIDDYEWSGTDKTIKMRTENN